MSYPNSDDENNISQEKNSEQQAQKEIMLMDQWKSNHLMSCSLISTTMP